mgnify:CR=1 FL=1
MADLPSEITDPLSKIAENGPFAGGVVLGCLLSYGLFYLASRERIARQGIDLKREQTLLEQNELKDKRIDMLHQELRKMQKKK